MEDGTPDHSWADEAPRRGSGDRLVRLALWGLALAVFEVTANPVLVVIIGCSKFGWAHLRAARWLARGDPNRDRGRACRWLYTAWGLWRISLTAAGLMFAFAIVTATLEKKLGIGQRQLPMGPFAAAALLAMLGFVTSTIVTLVGLGIAGRRSIRVWIGPEAIRAWRARAWPPVGAAYGTSRMGPMMLTALAFGLVLFVLPPLGGAFAALHAAPLTPRLKSLLEPCLGVVIVLVLWGFVYTVDRWRNQATAFSPHECWRPDERPRERDQDGRPPSINQSAFGNALR